MPKTFKKVHFLTSKDRELDYLYKEQVQMLRDISRENPNLADNRICAKWIQKFNKASDPEKSARNSLMFIMQTQLMEEAHLSEPFACLDNCNYDLRTVLRNYQIVNRANSSVNLSAATKSNSRTDTEQQTQTQSKSSKATLPLQPPPPAQAPANTAQRKFFPASPGNAGLVFNNAFRLQLIAQNLENEKNVLEHELEALHFQLTVFNMKKSYYNREIRRYNDEKKALAKQLDNLPLTLYRHAKKALEMTTFPRKLLQEIFAFFAEEDPKYMQEMQEFDNKLESLLNSLVDEVFENQKCHFASLMYQSLENDRLKLCDTYEAKLHAKLTEDAVQLKALKGQCFDKLRAAINEVFDADDKINVPQLLQLIQKKYENIIQEF